MGTIYTQLSLEERTMIHMQLEMDVNPAANATGVNRAASALSRELHRNGWTRPTTRCGPYVRSDLHGHTADVRPLQPGATL
jgi:IS30 family transposase